jgi:hypothetical protein
MLARLVLPFALLALPAVAQGPIRYAPASARYRLHSVVNRTQEMNGQKQQLKITSDQRVSLRMTPQSKDTLGFEITLDSTRIVAEPTVPLPDVAHLQGTKLTGAMLPTGKIVRYGSTADTTDASALTMVESMTHFLVTLPRDAKVGSTWTDTSSSSVKREDNSLDQRTITRSTILGDTTYAGEKAWRVRRESQLSLTGSQTQNGTTLNLAGSGTGTGMYYISQTGSYLGSTASQNMQMTMSIPAQKVTIPVTQNATSVVETVR